MAIVTAGPSTVLMTSAGPELNVFLAHGGIDRGALPRRWRASCFPRVRRLVDIRSHSDSPSTMTDRRFPHTCSSVPDELGRRLAEMRPGQIQRLIGPRQAGKTHLLRDPGRRAAARVAYAAGDLAGLLAFCGRHRSFRPLLVCEPGEERTGRAAGVLTCSWKQFLFAGPPD